MAGQQHEEDAEIAAIATIGAALGKIDDVDGRRRVISYVLARYMQGGASSSVTTAVGSRSTVPEVLMTGTSAPTISGSELPGIARLGETGDLRITVRDLKARSGLDAAVRLAYVAIYSNLKLTGQPLSSSKTLTPLLKQWRLYDGNTRNRLAKDKGMLRDGDNLSLDAHATRDAEQFIQEILDDDVKGKWKAS